MNRSKENFISIITPTYNASKFIADTIQSVKSQTHSNWELIIVDDCSTDTTTELVEKEIESDNRIKLIKLMENGGPANARNIALVQAKGSYIAFLDSDDLWHPLKLEKQLAFMKVNDIAFSYTAYRIMKENGELTDAVFHVPKHMNYRNLMANTAIGTLTVMLDSKKIGPFQMELFRDCSEDYGLWLSILSRGIVAYGINEELAFYRKCERSLSSNKIHSALKTWNTYRKIQRKSRFVSLWYLMNYSFHAVLKHSKTI